MKRLNDYHYFWQSCYQDSLTTSHLFDLVVFASDSGSSFYIRPDLVQVANGTLRAAHYASVGIDLAALAGAQVLSINGLDAWDYALNVGVPSTGRYPDPGQRLNRFAVFRGRSHTGPQERHTGSFSDLQDYSADSFNMTVLRNDGAQVDVTVPWLTSLKGARHYWNFTSAHHLYVAKGYRG